MEAYRSTSGLCRGDGCRLDRWCCPLGWLRAQVIGRAGPRGRGRDWRVRVSGALTLAALH